MGTCVDNDLINKSNIDFLFPGLRSVRWQRPVALTIALILIANLKIVHIDISIGGVEYHS